MGQKIKLMSSAAGYYLCLQPADREHGGESKSNYRGHACAGRFPDSSHNSQDRWNKRPLLPNSRAIEFNCRQICLPFFKYYQLKCCPWPGMSGIIEFHVPMICPFNVSLRRWCLCSGLSTLQSPLKHVGLLLNNRCSHRNFT